MDNPYSSEGNSLGSEAPELLDPMTPHQYPRFILYFFGFFALTLLYSLLKFPQQLSTIIDVKQGESDMIKGQYKEAAAHFRDASQKIPSTETRKNMIVAYLKMRTPTSIRTAFSELAQLRLNEKQMQQVQDVMPTEEELRRLSLDHPVVISNTQK
jgi:hypothetical protein